MVMVTTPQLLCRLDDIPDGGATAVDTGLCAGGGLNDTVSLILLRRGDQVLGYLNVCPHAGRRLDYAPGKFLLKDDMLICAVHGATFERTGGLCVAGPCRGEHLREVSVQVADGAVYLPVAR